MLKLIIIAAAAVWLLALLRHRHRRHGHHRCRRHWHRRHRAGGHLDEVLDELEVTPEQEQIIRDELRAFRARMRSVRDERGRTREDLAAAFDADSLNETLLGEMFARHDDVLRELREQAMVTLGRIHLALTPRQRDRIARFLGGGRVFGGPYRTAW